MLTIADKGGKPPNSADVICEQPLNNFCPSRVVCTTMTHPNISIERYGGSKAGLSESIFAEKCGGICIQLVARLFTCLTAESLLRDKIKRKPLKGSMDPTLTRLHLVGKLQAR